MRARQDTNRVIIHCSATKPEWWKDESVENVIEEFARWHHEKWGSSQCGYHFVIHRDGEIGEGRDEWRQGAHVRGHNDDSLGICLVGGHGSSANDNPREHFTEAQMEALSGLILQLQRRYPGISVHGHNEYSAKACPGFRAKDWWKGRKPRTSISQSTTSQAAGGVGAAGVAAAGAGLALPSGEDVAAAGSAAGDVLTSVTPEERTILIVGGLIILALALYIFRERLRKWKGGWT